MAEPNCVRCKGTDFGASAHGNLVLVHCTSCGGVVGVMDRIDVGTTLSRHGMAIASIDATLRELRDHLKPG